jgi:hypothetical protein
MFVWSFQLADGLGAFCRSIASRALTPTTNQGDEIAIRPRCFSMGAAAIRKEAQCDPDKDTATVSGSA